MASGKEYPWQVVSSRVDIFTLSIVFLYSKFREDSRSPALAAWRAGACAWPGIGGEGGGGDAQLLGRQEGMQKHHVVEHLMDTSVS